MASADLAQRLDLTEEESGALADLKSTLERMGRERGRLIPMLQLVQDTLAFLPPAAIRLVSDHLEISASEVYGVATFYNQFRFKMQSSQIIRSILRDKIGKVMRGEPLSLPGIDTFRKEREFRVQGERKSSQASSIWRSIHWSKGKETMYLRSAGSVVPARPGTWKK